MLWSNMQSLYCIFNNEKHQSHSSQGFKPLTAHNQEHQNTLIMATYSKLFTKYTSLLISTGHMRIGEQQLKTNTHNGHCNLM
jgi:hypothetical protein